MMAKLDTKAEQAAANGLQLDDERADSGESEDESPPTADKQNPQGASSPALGRAPAQKRAKKQPGAVWESACKLSGSAAPQLSQPGKVRTTVIVQLKGLLHRDLTVGSVLSLQITVQDFSSRIFLVGGYDRHL